MMLIDSALLLAPLPFLDFFPLVLLLMLPLLVLLLAEFDISGVGVAALLMNMELLLPERLISFSASLPEHRGGSDVVSYRDMDAMLYVSDAATLDLFDIFYCELFCRPYSL